MNAVDICNLALGRIGQGASSPIQSIDPGVDDSEAARACARSFPLAMKSLLREHPWSWAQGSSLLALSSESVSGFGYAFAYPADCITLHGLTPDGVDLSLYPASVWDSVIRPYPYRIVAAADGESRLIATNLSPARAHYTRSITIPAFADALFQDALAWKVAKEIALGLRANPQMAQAAESEYQIALSKAVAANDNEARRAPPPLAQDSAVYLGPTDPSYGDAWYG